MTITIIVEDMWLIILKLHNIHILLAFEVLVSTGSTLTTAQYVTHCAPIEFYVTTLLHTFVLYKHILSSSEQILRNNNKLKYPDRVSLRSRYIYNYSFNYFIDF